MNRYRKFIIKKLMLCICVAILSSFFFTSFIAAGSTIDLKKQIEEKNKELQIINLQIFETENRINALTGPRQTLQRELSSINYQIRQIELGVRASEVNSEKLKLEISELDNNLQLTNSRIKEARVAITYLLREIQRKDDEKFLEVFLRTASLSEGLLEFQSLHNFQENLVIKIGRLSNLAEQIDTNLKESVSKQNQLKVENTNLRNRQAIAQDQRNHRRTLLRQTQNQERIYQRELEILERKQTEIALEIEKIEDDLRLKIDPSALPTHGRGILMMPTRGPITQEYGPTRFARYAYPGQFHNGIDIGAPIGTPVFSAERGVIIATGDQDKYCRRGAYGKFIVIKHENNLTTLYAHLSRILVSEGERVERGSLIGYVGSTGFSTGPHLHFTVYATSTFYMGGSRRCGPMPLGGHMNPEDYL